ncbi:prephenate dehydratase [Heliorestis acidaminivorans]|uniref:Prephenate dehydratase n=1 Tax=Heliorestis acidaminivorans TaxID=553427 RepID=A0A6I0F4E7_9FIRM|nr:prephenate dehydratase [Heliorestis acidaminivorans]KAB2954630.1 prephenate dehydratase [Heliorestis acidaminivorans]
MKEKAIRAGYLGPEGTFSEEAAQVFFSYQEQEVSLSPFSSIPLLYDALGKREVDLAMLPVENSIEGTVNQTLDELIEHPSLLISGEIILSIHHCLLVRPDQEWAKLERVYSHPQALAQCRTFLEKNLAETALFPTLSTAEGAQIVAKSTEPYGAIASRFAALRQGLEVAVPDIQSKQNNKTRFLVIGRQLTEPTGADKTSIVFALPQDRPGGLYSILKEFAERQINLTRIESRPTKQELGHYLFFIDCLGHQRDPMVAEALHAIGKNTILTRILGSYKIGMVKE